MLTILIAVVLCLTISSSYGQYQYYTGYLAKNPGPIPPDMLHQMHHLMKRPHLGFQQQQPLWPQPVFQGKHSSVASYPVPLAIPPLPLHHQGQGQHLPSFRYINESVPQRESRFLSLFSTVVQFPRQNCLTNSGDNGTCLTLTDCQKGGGIPGGPCARNFGVCCIFMTTCGHSIYNNGTYFVNKGYPAAYNGTGSCQLILNKMHPDICQYRLDFEQFSIAGPEPVNHICNYDQFIVSGSNPAPTICGFNSGNHIYVDAGMGSNPVVLNVVTSGPEYSRNWKIRIIQIPCSTNYKADDGCLQYFTGIAGTIKSFNYEPMVGLHLSNQDYSVCIRTERNFCSVQYTQCNDLANNRSHSFTLSGNTLGQNAVQSMVGSVGANACNMDWLMIPCASNVGVATSGASSCVDRICGGTLNAEITTLSSTIYSYMKPFRLIFHTNNVESPNDMGNRGFCLNYVQQPCNNNIQ